MKSNTQLMDEITKMEPLEFAGLARLLGVSIVEKNEENKVVPIDFTTVLSGIMEKFSRLGRSKKREILRLVKKSNNIKRGHE